MSQSLYDLVVRAAACWPQKIGFICEEQYYTFAQLLQRAEVIACFLAKEFNIKKGDHVGILLHNSLDYVGILFAVWKLGAIAVPINTYLKAPEVAYIINNSLVKLLISSSEFDQILKKLKELPGINAFLWQIDKEKVSLSFPCSISEVVLDAEHPALIIYTSGTTGRPKGAILTHRNLLANVRSCEQALDITPDDCFGLVLPIFHSFMLTVCVLLPVKTGASVFIVRTLYPLRATIDLIVKNKVTVLPAMPQLFAAMAQLGVSSSHSLRICISGSAPLPEQVLLDFERAWGVKLLEGYGLSEASPVVSVNPIHGERRIRSVGIPIPGVTVTIRDEMGNVLPNGAIGEIWVKGENVMLGYWNDPQATSEVIEDGWLKTGDVGYIDGDGYLYITDRKKDMILVRGNNVYPREIEEILHKLSEIKEAAVVGEPDPIRGEHPVAFIVPKQFNKPLDIDAIHKFLRDQLADYKLPKKYRVVNELPRNATGKVLKGVLKEMLKGNSIDRNVE